MNGFSIRKNETQFVDVFGGAASNTSIECTIVQILKIWRIQTWGCTRVDRSNRKIRSFGHAICDRRLPRNLGNVFVAVTLLEDQRTRHRAKVGPVRNGLQVRATRKTSDFQNLLEFDRRAAEREHALLCADTEATKKQAFFEFTNFLETHAAALNANLLPPTSRQIVREKLIDPKNGSWR
jgi:hypothetical protein